MQVRLVFYGGLQRVVGSREMLMNLPESEIPLEKLPQLLLEEKPQLQAHIQSVVYSIGAKICLPDETIKDGDEVGLLPPVSGG